MNDWQPPRKVLFGLDSVDLILTIPVVIVLGLLVFGLLTGRVK